MESLNGTWRQKAACDPFSGVAPNPKLIPRFYPPDDEELSLHEQRESALFCNTVCPVQSECLEFALDVGEENGVIGGTTETERRHLMKATRQQRKKSA